MPAMGSSTSTTRRHRRPLAPSREGFVHRYGRPMPDPTIVAIGGGAFRYDDRYRPRPSALTSYALALTGKDDPKVTSLHTATGDPAERIGNWYQAWAGTPVRAGHLALFPMPNHDDVRAHLL